MHIIRISNLQELKTLALSEREAQRESKIHDDPQEGMKISSDPLLNRIEELVAEDVQAQFTEYETKKNSSNIMNSLAFATMRYSLTDFIGNSIDAGSTEVILALPEDKDLTLTNNKVIITLSDNGIGFPSHMLADESDNETGFPSHRLADESDNRTGFPSHKLADVKEKNPHGKNVAQLLNGGDQLNSTKIAREGHGGAGYALARASLLLTSEQGALYISNNKEGPGGKVTFESDSESLKGQYYYARKFALIKNLQVKKHENEELKKTITYPVNVNTSSLNESASPLTLKNLHLHDPLPLSAHISHYDDNNSQGSSTCLDEKKSLSPQSTNTDFSNKTLSPQSTDVDFSDDESVQTEHKQEEKETLEIQILSSLKSIKSLYITDRKSRKTALVEIAILEISQLEKTTESGDKNQKIQLYLNTLLKNLSQEKLNFSLNTSLFPPKEDSATKIITSLIQLLNGEKIAAKIQKSGDS